MVNAGPDEDTGRPNGQPSLVETHPISEYYEADKAYCIYSHP